MGSSIFLLGCEESQQLVKLKVVYPLGQYIAQVGCLGANGLDEGQHPFDIQGNGRLLQIGYPGSGQLFDGGPQVLGRHPLGRLGRGCRGLVDETQAKVAVQHVKDLLFAERFAYKIVAAGSQNGIALFLKGAGR
jgi:hypothetical protein